MKLVNVSLGVWAIPLALALWIIGAGSVASAQHDPHVGTWELNVAKSTFSPGPPPKRETLTFQPAGPNWMALLQGIDASGKPINPDMNNLAIDFDGKDHPTATLDYDTTAWKRIDPNGYQSIRKKAGKIVLTQTNVVSKDGQTMTITTKGVTADGQSINNVRVFDKR